MSIDSIISNAVQNIRDRFGAQGLRDLIDLAQAELVQVEAALSGMSDDREEEMGEETRQFFVYFDEENPGSRR